MSVKKDASGRRFVQLQLELPGTPEQVWHALATGPGISSWFVPTDLDEREDGRIAFRFGRDMDSIGRVVMWKPPARFEYEERDWSANAPPLATEIVIEARSGGTCIVRMVHSLFAATDEWDDQLDGFEAGWPSYFEVLRIYLSGHAGQPSSLVRLMEPVALSEEEAWNRVTRALGLAGRGKGDRVRTAAADGPALSGVLHHLGAKGRDIVVRLEEPAAGAGLFGVFSWGGRVMVLITLYLYGENAAGIAARTEPRWRAWLTPLTTTTQAAP